jgi:hypothetical protein
MDHTHRQCRYGLHQFWIANSRAVITGIAYPITIRVKQLHVAVVRIVVTDIAMPIPDLVTWRAQRQT